MPTKTKDNGTSTLTDISTREAVISQQGSNALINYRAYDTIGDCHPAMFLRSRVAELWALPDATGLDANETLAFNALAALKAANPAVDGATFAAMMGLVMAATVQVGDALAGFP